MGYNGTRWRGAILIVVIGLAMAAGRSGSAQNTTPRLNLSTAAGATELPVGPWGSYSTRHAGPCYLASRKFAPLFAFPIVVSQQRDEVLPIGSRAVDGIVRRLPERVTLLRRAIGLAPSDAARDAAGSPVVARIIDADSYGYLTTARVLFPEAAIVQEVAKRRDSAGKPLPSADWPAASAQVSWSAAFADNGAEGLVVRVMLSNPGAATQSFCIDLLGGLDRPDPLFAVADLAIEPDSEARGIPYKHKKMDAWMAIAAQQGDFAGRCYAVSGNHFSSGANACSRDTSGAPIPATTGQAAWALNRLSGIAVEPGETRTILLSIGLGRDSDGALTSARTLLSAAADRKTAAGNTTESIFALAEKAHETARYKSGSATIDGLMAQSLTNIPFHDLRRVGVASRESTAYYQPGVGAWMALGWGSSRPDWSAAQLNAWFVTQSHLPTDIKRVVSPPPTDLFVLWDLVQRTHDKDLLERFYLFAVWRYRQFLEAGRERADDWLFAWPVPKDTAGTPPVRDGLPRTSPPTITAPGENAQMTGADYAPEYSAYVILGARLLGACAKTLGRSADEQKSFSEIVERASAAMSKELWRPSSGLFIAKPIAEADLAVLTERSGPLAGQGLESLLPFIAGQDTLTPEQESALRKHLANTDTFLSPAGLRSRSAKSAAYRPGDAYQGGILFGAQWLLWKSLLDRGDSVQAADLAARVLASYEKVVTAGNGFPEALNADTGLGLGRQDSSGDACALIALHAAYHRVGTVSCGWDVSVLDDLYDRAKDYLRVTFRATVPQPKGVILCVMGKPGAKYHATGGIAGDFTSDAAGVLSLPMPNDKTTQQVEITTAGTAN